MDSFKLDAIPPFRLDLTVWALRRRPHNMLDLWDGSTYTRALLIQQTPALVEIEQHNQTQIYVRAHSSRNIPNFKKRLANLLNKMLGLQIDLSSFYQRVKHDRNVYALVNKFAGVKPPRFPTLFEAIVNAIACQQLSLEAGLSILNRFIQNFGQKLKNGKQLYYAFPEPETIAKASIPDIMKAGFSKNKSETLVKIANEMSHSDFSVHFEELPNELVDQALRRLKGIGRWSAEYILLRGLGRTNILPVDDVAVQKSIQNLLKTDTVPTRYDLEEFQKTWHPYSGVLYFHFLLQKLSEKGVLKERL